MDDRRQRIGTSNDVGTRAAKDALFAGLASVAKALASGRRAEIIELLAQGERTVEQVAAAIDQSVANTSHHLRTLARAGLVATRPEGTRVHYRLASLRVADMWRAMRGVASDYVDGIQQLADAYLGERDGLEMITREELAERLRRRDVTLIDVRPESEYEAGHVAGAISVPVDQLARRLDQLPTDTEIVAYCRGPYCVYADQAVRSLTQRGRAAKRLEDGYPEWATAGLPVETGRR
ncbi:MAG: metalloregulator ArsR/SmtB family transcription factor [Actinobacteria bacterium]|nr:metalloregulator ArsR/SmtB family transcription factor [Actinomycetota bacterium]